MKKILLIILLLPLFSFAQETWIVDVKDTKVGNTIQAKQTEVEKFKLPTSYEKISLLFESNINYAPLGLKLIFVDDSAGIGGYITAKISEDYILRDVYHTRETASITDKTTVMDMNELIIGLGFVFNVNKGIDFYLGSGVMAGRIYVPDYYSNKTSFSQWKKTDSSKALPMVSFGIVLAYERLKFTMGNETAFSTDNRLPGYSLNTKSFGRLSSFTFGMGYTF